MKRWIPLIALCAGLAVPATATAGIVSYAGKLKGGGKIGMRVQTKRHKPKHVLETRVRKVPGNCTIDGPSRLAADIVWGDPGLPVVHGQFVFNADVTGGHILQTGDFSHHNKIVSGAFRVSFDDGSQTCSSQKQRYHAARGNTLPPPLPPKMKALIRAR